VVGFGTSRMSNRKARTGRELNTGEEITIEARNVPKFVAGKGLKRAAQEGSGE
jgi:nucleoid DNA-binding protein